MNTNKDNTPTLLAILAHPDDESFGPGGTLAFYASQGVNVHLITATRGEVGTVDPDFLEQHGSIAELRTEKELRCAANILGISEVHLLDYRDSGMPGSPDNHHPQALAAAPTTEVADKLVQHIRKLRPQVIITHDPIGGYKHPDHIAVHHAAVQAFHAAGDPEAFPGDQPAYRPQKLYYATLGMWWLRPLVKVLPFVGVNPREFGRNKDIDLVELTQEDPFPTHAVINYRAVANKKAEASACHASQLEGGPPSQGIWRVGIRLVGPRDHFTRAYPPANPGLREKDLFAGVKKIEATV
jgi:N-acetyl-1-D-myo-inositol-2-amino-2-deoxy-alpha-D-glucopyranoside deacetylase/mycothiol S-conjugate amidase